MRDDDVVRVRHMLDAAVEACSFVEDRTRQDLNDGRMLVHSLVRCIEIVGEAASKVSEETRKSCREIPWVDIVGMRNRLVHAYFDIDLNRVWDTVTDDLPPLISSLNKVLDERASS